MTLLRKFAVCSDVSGLATDPATLAHFAGDMTENPEGSPDAVVTIETLDELQAVVKVAAATRTPLIPTRGGHQPGRAHHPRSGVGFILDLTRITASSNFTQTTVWPLSNLASHLPKCARLF